MRTIAVHIIACIIAASVPFISAYRFLADGDADFSGWPKSFEGHSLRQQELSGKELDFAKGFPGKIARFSDGSREIIIRWVTVRTRKLHPASDCFRGMGYTVQNLPLYVDQEHREWNNLEASLGDIHLHVRELIFDDHGSNWSTASSWYWAVLLGKTEGPWWAVTIAERPQG
jgi:hypothetical protein